MKILFISSECELLSFEYLAAALKSGGHEVELLLDPRLFDNELLAIKPLAGIFDSSFLICDKVARLSPDLIGFSVAADNFNWAKNLALRLKTVSSAPIVFGGIHPTLAPEEVIKHDFVDYLCVGEGEAAVVDLADSLERGADTSAIPNIWARAGNRVFRNAPRKLIMDLDSIPFPDKGLYERLYEKFMRGYKIIASRGCPYSCSYCAAHQISGLYSAHGVFYRKRSPENVVGELKDAKERFNVRMVRFFDEVFTADKVWLRQFAELYKKHVALPYFCFVHPNNADEETVSLLETSGCATAFMGFGTFSEEVRADILRRRYTNEKVRRLINIFVKSRIYLIVDFILGIPGQTMDEVIKMAHFFNENRPDAVSGLFLRYYAGTAITTKGGEMGLLTEKQTAALGDATWKDRIVIEDNLYNRLKQVQGAVLFAKYLPKALVSRLLDRRIYKLIPSVDWNNVSVIIDSVLPKLSGKRRIHTDVISPLQHLHFYVSHAAAVAWYRFGKLKKRVLDAALKARLVYRLGFSRISPVKFIQIARYLTRNYIFRQPRPGAAILGVTYRCQCKCVHCSVGYENSGSGDELSSDQIKTVLDNLAAMDIPKVNFFGGEPLLVGDKIVDLIRHGSRKGLSVSIDTNAILLTRELVRKLKDAGINNLNVSLDSAVPLIHDELRGFKGAFQSAHDAMKWCVLEKIPCVISTYASKRAVRDGDLSDIIKLGRGIGVTAIKILFPITSGRWCRNTEELLTEQEKTTVYKLLDPGFVYLESLLFSARRGKKVCEALDRNIIYISPSGDVQICYTIPFSFGNIRRERLEQILARMWQGRFFNSIDNEYDCVMNNPHFRDKYLRDIESSPKLPIECGGCSVKGRNCDKSNQ